MSKIRAAPAHVSLRRNTENETGIQAAGHLNGRAMRTIRIVRQRGGPHSEGMQSGASLRAANVNKNTNGT
ncbi:MAG: hypothetical protein ACXWIW_12620, partial [Croceibacterium sp.]